jgi:hypothetical protein
VLLVALIGLVLAVSTEAHAQSSGAPAATTTTAGSAPASNGEAGKQASAILADTVSAVGGASSVHVVASVASGGASLAFDLKLLAGTGGEGTIREDGLSSGVVRINGTAYVNGGEAFWRHFAGATAAGLFSGRWVEGSATSGWFASVSEDLELARLIVGALAAHGPLTVGATTTLDGQPAIPLRDTTDGGTLYVAATGKPYPLEITAKGEHLTFAAWDQPLTLTPPSNPALFSALPPAPPAQIPSEGVSLVLPVGWNVKAVPVGVSSALKFFALAPKGLGFEPNLNLIVAPLPAGETLRQALFSGASAAYQYVGTTHTVTVNGVVGLDYLTTRAIKLGTTAVLTNIWLFARHGQLFEFTYTALASESAEYDSLFAASARTITFSASAGTTTA